VYELGKEYGPNSYRPFRKDPDQPLVAVVVVVVVVVGNVAGVPSEMVYALLQEISVEAVVV
jgi:hypothetical protein